MKRFLLLGLTLALAPWLALAQAAAQGFVLSNGMTLIVKPDRRAPTAVHMLWVRVGSMDEVDGTSGVAHALEHMMFKGTGTLAPGEFSRRVAALGGRENAFTMRDATAYHQQVPSDQLESVMRLEADRFANNRWPDDEFRREIEVIKEERRQRTEVSPRARMFEQMNAATYVAHPYRRPIIGWMSDLDAMTPDDVRDFHRRWYVPANAAVVVVGDVDVGQVRAWAEAHYGRIPARAVPVRKPHAEPEQQGARRIEYRARAEQAVVALSWAVPRLERLEADAAGTTDALALTVLSAVLDGYSGARLGRTLVQGQGGKRLADSVDASYGPMGRGPAVFSLTGVPAPGISPQELEEALKAEVARVARDGVDEAELRRVKTQWMAGEVYGRDSIVSQARELGSYWINGLPVDGPQRLMERLMAVTAEQVRDVARRHFDDRRLTVGVLRPEAQP